ncbi:Crp/Fnr family transcriptional regulator [Flavobacterium sp. LM4]|uniref:Crp/Fnr family transcriptional regulator n=1 Tax=Flavobacterium sp. LM4 TaxID=1938609 RepID=UPI0009934AFD|nr:Crp/Fnr family transcriptional regulator [Flavobacterium sp. LM4]OOV20486.1 cyclic nucleotide-binding protein [Flavobacterium sp. LM4]
MEKKLTISAVEPLLDYFKKRGYILNALENALVQEKFHSRLYRKKQYVLQEGDVCTKFNFVVRGCLRTYNVDKKGSIHILQFAVENNWINDLGSFHGMKPSKMNIDAIEDTVVLQINYEDLISLYKQSPIFDRIFRVLIENGYIHLQERLLQNISSTAEERYESFLSRFPHLINRISQVQIAAYLGVTPEFLSRLRNQRTKVSQKT